MAEPHAPAPPPRPYWYGWQALTSDGVSFTALGVGAALATRQGAREPLTPQILMWSGFAGAMLGAPIVHFSHGKVGRGFGSFGLRLAGVLALALAFPEGGGSDNTGAAAIALGLFGTAIILDATSHDDLQTHHSTARWSLSPMLGQRRGVLFVYRL